MTGMLEGKVALVTGGGNGIGRAAALVMAREGARVAVADFEAQAAAETVGMINSAGGQALSLSGDVTVAAALQAMVELDPGGLWAAGLRFQQRRGCAVPGRCGRAEDA